MKDKTFIFGASDLGRVLFQYLRNEDRAPEGFVVDDDWCNSDTFCGLPLIPFTQMTMRFPTEDHGVYVAVGYANMNAARQNIFCRLRALGYELLNYIHPSVINDSASMGSGNLVLASSVLCVDSHIGDGNIFVPGAMLSHDVKIGDFNYFSARALLAGDVTVGDRCFFGVNCATKNGIVIGDHCLVGAMSYVSENLKSDSILTPRKSVMMDHGAEEMFEMVYKNSLPLNPK